MTAAPLKPQTLTQQVARLIRERIVSGELPPGERIVEQTLAKSLGVGQNAVREALIELAHRGFVRRVTNRGTYVTKLSVDEAIKIAEVRAVLEGLAVERVHERWRKGEVSLAPLKAELAEMRAAAEVADRERFYDHDLAFHEKLWNLADNVFLGQMLEQVVVPLFASFIVLYMRRGAEAPELVEAVEAHERVLRQIESNGKSARNAMADLLDMSVQHQRGLITGHE